MMTNRECLYEVEDLKLEKVLHEMSDLQLNKYWEKLHAFIENYPTLEENLKTSLEEKNYKKFFTDFCTLRDVLREIHADDMVSNLESQIAANSSHDKIRHEKLAAYTTYFLATVSILSIDIQEAEYQALGKPEGTPEPEDIDSFMGTVSILSLDMSIDIQEAEYQALGKPKGKLEPEKTKAKPAEEQKNKPKPAREQETKTQPVEERKTILAVDDQVVHLNTLKAILADTPYKKTFLSSSEDALCYLEKNQPDLFILDIMMPGMDGYELAQRIKESGQGKIIFLTATATKETITKALAVGAADFIVKPTIKDIIIKKIDKCLGAKTA